MSLLQSYPILKEIPPLTKKRQINVYLIGGFLRDTLLGKGKKDFDFAVEKDALRFARSFSRKIKGAYVLLDKERGCARVVKKVKGEAYTFDFADFRAKTFKGDLGARDFTINTLAVDAANFDRDVPLRDLVIDVKGGLADLKAERIKMTSVRAFRDDPLRMLRAFSLQASLNFKIEQTTLKRIRKEKDTILRVSEERIRDELFKILESNRAAQVIRSMDRIGLLVSVIPQIKVMSGCRQGGYHHLDVWPHSLETLAQLETLFEAVESETDMTDYLSQPLSGTRSRKALIKLAALLHDIGKPETRRKEKDRLTFHGHEHVGQRIVRHVALMLKLSTDERHALEDMVRWHLRPGYLSNFKKPSKKAIYRYLRDTKEEAVSVLLLSLADQRATRGPMTTPADQKHHERICLQLVKRYFKKAKEQPFVRLINGNDLIKHLRLKPSPLFGKILSVVEEQQSLSKIKTKREALDLAKQMVKK